MSTRVVDIEKPYEWGTAIEVTQDKVINLRLRSENNLIIYDEWDNEIYVDLQLPSDIEPADAIPVWINTGRVLAADWWDYTGTIVVFKTTSWDNIKLLYADNGRVFIDNWTGTFKEIYLKWDVDALILGLRNYINDELAKKQDKLTAWANITIAEDPQTHELVISSTGWGWGSYTAWTGIDIDANNVISVDSTYMAWYIPRSNGIYPDNLADSVLYYGEYLHQWTTTALGLASDQVTVRADIDQQNRNKGYLEYYNWAVDLYLSDTVSGVSTTAMYKSTGIKSTAGWTTETFEFQWTWNNKIARLKDIPSASNFLPRTGALNPDVLTNWPVYYWTFSDPIDLSTYWVWINASGFSVEVVENNQNRHKAYLDYYNWMVELLLRDTNGSTLASTIAEHTSTYSKITSADFQANISYESSVKSDIISVETLDNTSKDRGRTDVAWKWVLVTLSNDNTSDYETSGLYHHMLTYESEISWTRTYEIYDLDPNGTYAVARMSDLSGYVLQSWTTQNVLSYTNSSKTVEVTTSYMWVSTSSQAASIWINSSSNWFLFLWNKNNAGSRINMDWESLEYYGATSATNASYSFAEGSVNQIAKKSDVSVVSWDSNTYSIVVSNSAPASWTPNTTLTFVV